MGRKKTRETLNQAVADLSQFAAIIHQAHWYMRGRQFLSLHPKMDELMDEINGQLDQIAERLIIIGGAPHSTLAEFASKTKLKDQKGDFDVAISKRMENLLKGYQYLAELYQKGIDAAGQEGDAVTEDLFTSLKAAIEKNVWMISATLEKAPAVEST